MRRRTSYPTRKRDVRRRTFLEAQSLTVIVVPDTDDQPLNLAAIVQQLAPYLSNQSLPNQSGQACHTA